MPIQRNTCQHERNERKRCKERLVYWPRGTHYVRFLEDTSIQEEGSPARKMRVVMDEEGRRQDIANIPMYLWVDITIFPYGRIRTFVCVASHEYSQG